MTRYFVPCAGLALLATLGCASGKPAAINTAPPVTVTPVTQRVITTGGGQLNINTVSVNSGMTVQILAPIDSAWPALQAVYRELGIPVTTLQDASHLIGNETFKTRRRIGKLPMQRILNCGELQGMPNAETYDIMMSISSYFVKNPKAGYSLITRIDATGKSPNYSREASVNCSSQGELEQLISEMVKSKTGS